MANENEDSFPDDPLEEINLDDDDLDDLLGEGDAENTNDDSSEDDDLLSDEDLLDVESEDEDSSGEISEEELDSLLSEAEDDGGGRVRGFAQKARRHESDGGALCPRLCGRLVGGPRPASADGDQRE